mmetsp:Transcript_4734/g.9507  ORF Transcript_4734/g.9507 Transcript_4734/m.9507 type:complete len:137 (-) Transcript_4734:36-446(-)
MQMKFCGGKDDRKTPDAAQESPQESTPAGGVLKLKVPPMPEGTYQKATLEILEEGNWKCEERGGHQFRHSRASVVIISSGSWVLKEVDGVSVYEFTVSSFQYSNTDRRVRSKDETGKVITRPASIFGMAESVFPCS